MRTAFTRAQEAVNVDGIPTINFARWTEFHTCLKDILRHKSPDVSRYRQETAGVQAYLEHQLRGISVGSTTDRRLEERGGKLRQQEGASRQRRVEFNSVGMLTALPPHAPESTVFNESPISQDDGVSIETTTLEGLIENLILSCASIKLHFCRQSY